MLRLYILVASFGICFSYKDGLYATEDDDVRILNSDSFKADVWDRNPGQLWVVEFYNSWCGHCINFAPTWRRVAIDYKDWHDVVVVGAIDCSQAVNVETCRANNITAYPTMKIFPPVDSRGGQVQKIESHQLEVIKLEILKYMGKNAADSWPTLEPLEKIKDILQEKKDGQNYLLVIFETNTSSVGTQVTVDVRREPRVLVRRMLKESASSYGISRFPSLYRVNLDSSLSLLAIGSKFESEDRVAFVRVIKSLAKNGEEDENMVMTKSEQGAEDGGGVRNNGSILLYHVRYNSSVVSMQDFESSLHYLLRHEVTLKTVIQGEGLAALQSFVKVLTKYFPGRKFVQGFLRKVSGMLTSLGNSSISGKEWLDKINSLQDKDNFLPNVSKWEACQGSLPRFRGYPCGLWKLFHALTVAAYNQSRNKKTVNPQRVLLAVRGYMQHFFGCKECVDNFLFMARFLDTEVQSYEDSVLWLWRTHNRANERLHGDASEDPLFPKVKFPPVEMCLECHIRVPEADGMHLAWDEDKVLEFLANFYSEKNILSSKDFQLIAEGLSSFKYGKTNVQNKQFDWLEQNSNQVKDQQGPVKQTVDMSKDSVGRDGRDSYSEKMEAEQDGHHVFTVWGLTHLDLSMCVIFYVISTVTLIIMYHHFIIRRQKMPWPCRIKKTSLPL